MFLAQKVLESPGIWFQKSAGHPVGNTFFSDLGLSNLKISPSVQTKVAPSGGTKLREPSYVI